jgi:hypothetical protein
MFITLIISYADSFWSKSEYLNDDEIIENYKRLKELQRIKNKAAYENLNKKRLNIVID